MINLLYILEFLRKYDEMTENKTEEENACEIIDIANEEMKKIDSSKIDSEFKKVFTKQATQNIIDLIGNKNCEQKDLDNYLKTLNDEDVLDIRFSEKTLYIKTTKRIIPLTLSQILNVEEKIIEEIPINSRYYNFYLINCEKWSSIFLSDSPSHIPYDPEDFVEILKDIGGDCLSDDLTVIPKLSELVQTAFDENWLDMPDDIGFIVEIEDKVVAIAIDQFIPNSKEILSEVLFINPKILIEVSTPIGTVLLIDTRRWYLEPNFGDEEWYH